MFSALKTSPSRNVIDTLVGANLSEIRQSLGVSQERLAERLGTTVDEVHGWEHGHRHIDARNLIGLAQALGVSVGAFWASI